jgi:hypothetical protein
MFVSAASEKNECETLVSEVKTTTDEACMDPTNLSLNEIAKIRFEPVL